MNAKPIACQHSRPDQALQLRFLGLLLALRVTSASVQNRVAAAPVVAQAMAKAPGLRKLCTDGADGGQCARAIETAHPTRAVEVVRHPGNRRTGTWQDAR